MALTLTQVPDIISYLGPSIALKVFLCVPAASDYTTGGYVITPSQVGFGYVLGGDVLCQKYSTTSVLYQVTLPNASFVATTVGPSTSQLTVAAYQSATLTPAGTITSTITTTTSAFSGNAINISGGALVSTSGASGVTGITSTFSGTATTAAFLSEVAASTDLSASPFWLKVWGY